MVNKKGDYRWIPLAAIITILIFVSFILIFPSWLKAATEEGDRSVCENSVSLRAKSKILNNPTVTDLTCKTFVREIKTTDQDKIFEKIRDDMYDCWRDFGEGTKDFLNTEDFGKGDNWCFICSRFDFDEKVQKEISYLDFEDFNNYLKEEPLPPSGSINFYEYFYGKESNLDSIGSVFMNTKDPIYVVFFADKRLDLWRNPDKTEWTTVITGCAAGIRIGLLGGVPGAAIGCAGGVILGIGFDKIARKQDYLTTMYVGNGENIVEVCGQ